MLQKTKLFIVSHKIISGIILVLVIVSAYFLFFKNKTSGEVQYITETVSKGSITTNVSGTGQVEA